MKISKVSLILGIVVILSVVASACQPAAAPAPAAEPTAAEAKPAAVAPTAEPAKKLVFGLVTKALNNPFWDYMHAGAKEVADANNAEIIYLAPTKPNNLEEQTRLVDDLIAKKVDGIVLVPVDSAGIVPAIERANAAGIPVALANTNAKGGKVVTFSAVENYEAMTLVAEALVAKVRLSFWKVLPVPKLLSTAKKRLMMYSQKILVLKLSLPRPLSTHAQKVSKLWKT
jgi:ABC-type sugar transport system substrate-binding protein